jgi:hypothetical protein
MENGKCRIKNVKCKMENGGRGKGVTQVLKVRQASAVLPVGNFRMKAIGALKLKGKNIRRRFL